MTSLLETLKRAGQARHNAATPLKSAGMDNRSALTIISLALLAVAGLASHFWLQIGPPAPVSTASAALAPPPLPVAVAVAVLPRATATADAPPPPAPEVQMASETALPVRPIRIATAKARIDPGLLGGYEAYMAGDLAAAREAYELLLAREARNIDALHGMAAISLRQGQPAAAEGYYLRALELDPKESWPSPA
jgi:tetratricopeptide (TPR) repeat protein